MCWHSGNAAGGKGNYRMAKFLVVLESAGLSTGLTSPCVPGLVHPDPPCPASGGKYWFTILSFIRHASMISHTLPCGLPSH